MAALRAMLQLRSNSQSTGLLPSQQPTYQSHNHHSHHSRRQKFQPEPSSSSLNYNPDHNHASSSLSNINTTNNTPHRASNSSSISSAHSLSNGSPHHGHAAFTAAAAAVAAATLHGLNSPSPHKGFSSSTSKKQAPFQNLGLHSGAAMGNLGLVKFALDNGQPIDSILNGVSAIHAACCSNTNVAVVLFLIERGADVNARRLPRKHSNEKGVQTVGTTGSTPLHFAAANGCLAVVDILLRHGAIVDMTDKYGSSPLSVAGARNHPDVASLLRQYSAMQRGVQDLTPEMESKDPMADRRSSLSSSTRSSHEKDTSSQSLPIPSTRLLPSGSSSPSTTRAAGQRRISLPSIIESPSSPNIPAAPRQSCDFGRQPHSTEPLAKSATFIRSTPAAPTRNFSKSSSPLPYRQEDRQSGTKSPAFTPTPARTKKTGPGRTTMQRSHTSHGGNGTYLTAPDGNSSVQRRRSMESVGFLSPQAATTINRRKSFGQLSALSSNPESKIRRSSDASTASRGTASSGTAGSVRTVDTAASDAPSEFASPEESNHSKEIRTLPVTKPIDSGTGSLMPSPLARSTSQPVLEHSNSNSNNMRLHHRSTMLTVNEPIARQSLDLQMLISNKERQERRSTTEIPRNDSDSDLPQQLYRRRTVQEQGQQQQQHPKMVSIPRNLSMGPTIEVLGGSSASNSTSSVSASGSNSTSDDSAPRNRTMTTSNSSASLQEFAPRHSFQEMAPRHSFQEMAPRHSTSSISSNHSTLSFSGSATVSGRFSRIWSGGKDTNGSNWSVGEFADASGDAAAQGLVRSDQNRTRSSVLNRLSGIWSRR